MIHLNTITVGCSFVLFNGFLMLRIYLSLCVFAQLEHFYGHSLAYLFAAKHVVVNRILTDRQDVCDTLNFGC